MLIAMRCYAKISSFMSTVLRPQNVLTGPNCHLIATFPLCGSKFVEVYALATVQASYLVLYLYAPFWIDSGIAMSHETERRLQESF